MSSYEYTFLFHFATVHKKIRQKTLKEYAKSWSGSASGNTRQYCKLLDLKDVFKLKIIVKTVDDFIVKSMQTHLIAVINRTSFRHQKLLTSQR